MICQLCHKEFEAESEEKFCIDCFKKKMETSHRVKEKRGKFVIYEPCFKPKVEDVKKSISEPPEEIGPGLIYAPKMSVATISIEEIRNRKFDLLERKKERNISKIPILKNPPIERRW